MSPKFLAIELFIFQSVFWILYIMCLVNIFFNLFIIYFENSKENELYISMGQAVGWLLHEGRFWLLVVKWFGRCLLQRWYEDDFRPKRISYLLYGIIVWRQERCGNGVHYADVSRKTSKKGGSAPSFSEWIQLKHYVDWDG